MASISMTMIQAGMKPETRTAARIGRRKLLATAAGTLAASAAAIGRSARGVDLNHADAPSRDEIHRALAQLRAANRRWEIAWSRYESAPDDGGSGVNHRAQQVAFDRLHTSERRLIDLVLAAAGPAPAIYSLEDGTSIVVTVGTFSDDDADTALNVIEPRGSRGS